MKEKNKNLTLSRFLMVILFFTFYSFHSGLVRAQRLSYPVAELGNCRDNRECYLYCEIPEHKPACWSYGKYLLPRVLGENTQEIGDDQFKDLDEDMKRLEAETENTDEESAMEEKARRYNVTFPIDELDKCGSYKECKVYCERPENQERCIAFAKKKGFYKEYKDGDYSDLEKRFLQKAKEILGCSTKEECHQFCEEPNNHDRCEEFARKLSQEGVRTGYSPAVDKVKMLEMAKAELGCDSYDACRQFCEKNMKRCMEFAKRHGLNQENKQENKQEQSRRMEKARSLGCDSEESCRKYCSEHPTECPGYPSHEYIKPSQYPHTTYYPQPTYTYTTGYPTYYQQPTYYQGTTSNSSYSYPAGYHQPTANNTYSSNTTY